MGRGLGKNTLKRRQALFEVLEDHHPMTVRQAFYQLVSKQIVKNNESRYEAVGRTLIELRKEGIIPWSWIEDRTRRPRTVNMWVDLNDFKETACRAYRRDVWKKQDKLIEVWLEKDALSGIFENILYDYGITLNVGRGYDGWSSIHDAAMRYQNWEQDITVLYFGDFDPSGEDMFRSLKQRLEYFETRPEMRKCAILKEDIAKYNLPPDFTKISDSRQPAFIEKWGDIAVELDALPIDVLQERIRSNIENEIDTGALVRTKEEEEIDKEKLSELFDDL